jgi:hypothetical protein
VKDKNSLINTCGESENSEYRIERCDLDEIRSEDGVRGWCVGIVDFGGSVVFEKIKFRKISWASYG